MISGPHRLGEADLCEVVGGSGQTKTRVEDSDMHDKLPETPGTEEVQGSAYGDVIGGKEGTQHVFGNAGDDFILAGAGNDLIDGGTGNDTVHWRPGDGGDLIRGGDGNDTLALVLDQDTLDRLAGLGGLAALVNAVIPAPDSPPPRVGDGYIDLTGVTGHVILGQGQIISFSGFERLVLTRG